MKGTLKKLRRLKGRGLDELRVRGAQALAARAERLRVGAPLPTDAEWSRLLLPTPPGPAHAAVLHARADYKYVAGAVTEETLWLCGVAGLEAFDVLEARPPAEGSRAFPE